MFYTVPNVRFQYQYNNDYKITVSNDGGFNFNLTGI